MKSVSVVQPLVSSGASVLWDPHLHHHKKFLQSDVMLSGAITGESKWDQKNIFVNSGFFSGYFVSVFRTVLWGEENIGRMAGKEIRK